MTGVCFSSFQFTILFFIVSTFIDIAYCDDKQAERYEANADQFRKSRVTLMQRVWQPIKSQGVVSCALSYFDVQHAGLLLFLQEDVAVIVHKTWSYGTVLEDYGQLLRGDWEPWGNMVEVPNIVVKKFMEIGGPFSMRSWGTLDSSVLAATRMMHLAAPKEEFSEGLAALKCKAKNAQKAASAAVTSLLPKPYEPQKIQMMSL